MKRPFVLTLAALAALLAASCQKEEEGRVLTATIEQYEHHSKDDNGASKAYINNEYYACWENGDLVNINGTQCTISFEEGTQGTANSATINGASLPTGQNLLAYYPASQVTRWIGNSVTVTLPQVQQYRESNGHQVIDNPMAAYCPEGSNELKFRNLGALLKVTIQAPSNEGFNLKAIAVKGDDGQMLWGTTQLTLDNQNKPMLEKMSNGGDMVSLHFENPEPITVGSSKSFYIVVPDGSTFKEITIVVATDQAGYRKVSKINQSLPRNHIGALTYAPTEEEKLLPIFYTGSIQGFRPASFGDAQVLSSDGGVILFDRSLTTIGDDAFRACTSLISITLPASLTTIGISAFSSCSGLTSISLPASLTTIEDYAFSGCTSLTSITLPANLTTIGISAFSRCSGLTSITLHANLTRIGISAFSSCSGLTSITLPESLISIGSNAFRYCTSLSTVDVNRYVPSDHFNITQGGLDMFNNCPLTGIHVPSNAVYEYKNAPGWSQYSDIISAMPTE